MSISATCNGRENDHSFFIAGEDWETIVMRLVFQATISSTGNRLPISRSLQPMLPMLVSDTGVMTSEDIPIPSAKKTSKTPNCLPDGCSGVRSASSFAPMQPMTLKLKDESGNIPNPTSKQCSKPFSFVILYFLIFTQWLALLTTLPFQLFIQCIMSFLNQKKHI